MKTASHPKKALRIGLVLMMLLSLFMTLLPIATFAQSNNGVVPTATESIDNSFSGEFRSSASENGNINAAMIIQPTAAASTTSEALPTLSAAPATGTAATIPTSVITNRPNLETKLTVNNLTKGMDATTAKNEPGDIIHVTATVKNLGPTDLTNYEAVITAEKLFKMGTVINPGDGGTLRQEMSMAYPIITQTKDCGCTNKFEFTVKLNENICIDSAAMIEGGLSITYEDLAKKIAIVCGEAPVRTEVTTPAVTPPTPPKTGPELYLLFLAAGALGYYAYRRKVAYEQE